jgi:flagellar basal-body rod modification protein FlgD
MIESLTGSAGPGSSILGPGGLGKEDFLRLLVTQLQYQDPLDPLDAQDFASQLAEFTAMEQQLITNELLEAQIEMNTAAMLESQNSVAIGMIGTGIVTEGDQVALDGSGPQSGYVATSGPATLALHLTDGSGAVVLTTNAAVSASGVQRIDLGSAAESLPPGRYTLSVEILAGAADVTARPLASGLVDGVRWSTDGPVLVVGEREVPLSNILEITR